MQEEEEVVVVQEVELTAPDPSPEVTLHGPSSILNENRDLEYANEREDQHAGNQRGETGEE